MPYKDIEDLPFRSSMRRSAEGGYMRDNYGSKVAAFYTWLDAFLRSCIGKRTFNEAYSILSKRYPNNVGWLNPKEQFRGRFDNCGWWRYGGYYVDEEGVIRRLAKKTSKKKFIVAPTEKARSTYRFDYYLYELHHSVLWVLDYSRRNIVKLTGRITFDEYIRIKNSSYWNKAQRFLEKMDESEYETAQKGCRRYSQLRAEKRSKQRKAERDHKKSVRRMLEEDCSWQFRGHKLRTKEIQRKEREVRKREELQNLIDRERLGFDEESFMGSNYNSRKGKKMKRLLNDKTD